MNRQWNPRMLPRTLARIGNRTPRTTLTCRHQCRLLSAAPSSTVSWEDSLRRNNDLINAWSDADIAPFVGKGAAQQDYAQLLALDKSSRFVIQLLYDMYHNVDTWGELSYDRATTQRCEVILEQLAQLTMPSPDSKQPQVTALSGSVSKRAYDILQGMELFYGRLSDERTVLPHPTGRTYLTVLRMFAKDPLGSPKLAEQIVQRMQQRYDELPGQLELQPNVVHWNQVLSAWAATGIDDEKAFHAASLLQELKSRNMVDISSYSHVLRACARSYGTSKRKKLGAQVAVRVYKEFRKRTDMEPNSFLYLFFLKACVNIQDPTERDREALIAWEDCRTAGYVNHRVISAFREVASTQLFGKVLGGPHNRSKGNPPTLQLLKRLPASYSRNAKD